MDKKSMDEIKASLLEINELVAKLDPSIRAAAFEILRPLYFGRKQIEHTKEQESRKSDDDSKGDEAPTDLSDFIAPYDHKKPADNVMLLAAWLYSNYGTYPITAKEIKELGDSCGLILPGRPDNTMRQGKNKGKSLFNQQGKGWQPTVSGELFFKEEYKVKKGTKPLPKE
jgi:hypothetical protein